MGASAFKIARILKNNFIGLAASINSEILCESELVPARPYIGTIRAVGYSLNPDTMSGCSTSAIRLGRTFMAVSHIYG
jgi:hypothetical protein